MTDGNNEMGAAGPAEIGLSPAFRSKGLRAFDETSEQRPGRVLYC